MTLTNDGTLTIEKGYTEQFIKLLIDQNIIETPKDVGITEENETVDVELSEIYGNLTDSLENLCESCKKEGINVDGLIGYCGDYDGTYEIIGTVFHEYLFDKKYPCDYAKDLALALKSELKRREKAEQKEKEQIISA